MNIRSLYPSFAAAANYLQSPLLLIVRLYWGIQFILTGWGKLGNLSRTGDYFASLHLPAPHFMAAMAGGTELIGGVLLAIGLVARFASLALAFTMAVAFATAEREALGSFFHDTDKFTGATPFLFLFASLVVLAFGPGCFSVDRFVFGAGKEK